MHALVKVTEKSLLSQKEANWKHSQHRQPTVSTSKTISLRVDSICACCTARWAAPTVRPRSPARKGCFLHPHPRPSPPWRGTERATESDPGPSWSPRRPERRIDPHDTNIQQVPWGQVFGLPNPVVGLTTGKQQTAPSKTFHEWSRLKATGGRQNLEVFLFSDNGF